jgi:RNA polymerase primary sigma factor
VAISTGASAHRTGSRPQGDVGRPSVALAEDDTSSSDRGATDRGEIDPTGVTGEGWPSASGSDLAWMFGEEPEQPPLPAADDIVGRALDDLLGDWSRRGGRLTRADVSLLTSTRGLTSAQHGELLSFLEDAGVELPHPTGPRPRRAGQQGYEFHEDAVGQYLRTICRYPLIDGPREVELWSLISQGAAAQNELDKNGNTLPADLRRSLRTQAEAGRHAHADLVCANLRLVVSIAKARQYDSCGVEFADRIQDGNLGLMRAADKFDGSKGFKFSTYATWWIRQSIERGIGDRGRLVRVPIHFHERIQKVRRAVSRLTARLDHKPSLAEIADATGMEPGQVQAVLDLARPVASLDQLLGDEGDLHLSDVLLTEEERDGRTDPAEIVVHATMRADLKRLLAEVLPPRAVLILERRYGIGTGEEETLDKIGEAFGLTRERIRQIQNKSLTEVRQSALVDALRPYLVDDSKTDQTAGGMRQ